MTVLPHDQKLRCINGPLTGTVWRVRAGDSEVGIAEPKRRSFQSSIISYDTHVYSVGVVNNSDHGSIYFLYWAERSEWEALREVLEP